jgi:hypothetical protein
MKCILRIFLVGSCAQTFGLHLPDHDAERKIQRHASKINPP